MSRLYPNARLTVLHSFIFNTLVHHVVIVKSSTSKFFTITMVISHLDSQITIFFDASCPSLFLP
jgi:hypothetical protein